MIIRILTALPLALLVVSLLWWGPLWLFLLALVVTVEIGLYEFFFISRQSGFKTFPAVGYTAGAALCVAQALELGKPGALVWIILVSVILLTLSLALTRIPEWRHYLGAVSTTIFGILYVAFTLSWLVPLRFSPHGPAWATGRELVLFLFLVIWADDIFAYLVGRSIGRTLLFPDVSPKKTVEGSVAGFAASLLVAWVFTRWLWQTADLKAVVLWAGLVAIAGQLGDLVESAFKRGANIKDSGTLLPGHGGLLDRIDSLLFGAPTLWLAFALTGLLGRR